VPGCGELCNDLIPFHLEDPCDLEWWKCVGGGSLASSAGSLSMDMSKSLYSFVLPKLLIQNFTGLLFSPPSSLTPNTRSTNLSSLPTQTVIHSATQTLVCLPLLYTAASTVQNWNGKCRVNVLCLFVMVTISDQEFATI
jgi:cytoplasmic tRNA 2-thiolation protein 2